MADKICPIYKYAILNDPQLPLPTANGPIAQCDQEKCAWWDEVTEKCSICLTSKN